MIKILFVEDNEQTMKAYVKSIEGKKNFELVGKAYNGIEAIEILKNKEVSFVILDLMMPELDGIEVLKYIDGMSKKPNVIITSGISTSYTVSESMKHETIYYLLKPFNIEVLINKIEEIEKDKNYNFLVESKINSYLNLMGIPCRLKGYIYLKKGIERIVHYGTENPNINMIYLEIARIYNVTPKSVEKSIRDVVAATFEKGDVNNIEKMFKSQISAISGKVTNKTFLYTISRNIAFSIEN